MMNTSSKNPVISVIAYTQIVLFFLISFMLVLDSGTRLLLNIIRFIFFDHFPFNRFWLPAYAVRDLLIGLAFFYAVYAGYGLLKRQEWARRISVFFLVALAIICVIPDETSYRLSKWVIVLDWTIALLCVLMAVYLMSARVKKECAEALPAPIPLRIKRDLIYAVVLLFIVDLGCGFYLAQRHIRRDGQQMERMGVTSQLRLKGEQVFNELTNFAIEDYFAPLKKPVLGQHKKILYLGNSLSYGVLEMVAEMARARGHTVAFDAHLPGGYKLHQHAGDERSLELIAKQPWDLVLLQEHSQLPSFELEAMKKKTIPAVHSIEKAVHDAHPGAQLVYYLTMAHRDGDNNKYTRYDPIIGGPYENMQKRVIRGYKLMVKETGGLIAPVGLIWMKVRAQRPDIELYQDYVHPTKTGAYLAACTLYATFFNDTPVGLPMPEGLDPEQAHYIQNTVHEVIFEK